ncbi:DUF721 domain-containing protein [bacterium]|nr:DUF721 domain-containing protein [bacterium]
MSLVARARKTLRFDEAAARVLKKADTHQKRYGASAVNAWDAVVGGDIASHTRGFALRDDRELVVFVDSGAWANQLALMAPELIARINEYIGQDAVRSLRFTVSRRVKEGLLGAAAERDAGDFYSPEEDNPLPLNETEMAQVSAVAAPIKQEALREAAVRAMIRDLEQKKGKRSNTA